MLACTSRIFRVSLIQKQRTPRSCVLEKYSNKLIPVFSICKKLKGKQEKRRSKRRWKEFAQKPWPCTRRKIGSQRRQRYLKHVTNWSSVCCDEELVFSIKTNEQAMCGRQ